MLADWYTALGLKQFPDWNMNQLTMFADYRVPAILHDKGTTKVYCTNKEGRCF